MPLPANTISATHSFVSAVADSLDPDVVQPSHWNDAHAISGFGVIGDNITLTVAASGADYTTVGAALEAIKNYWIASNAVVTISVAGEVFAESPIVFRHACGACVKIVGADTLVRSMTSVVSSSGSAGAWSNVIQLNDNSGISVGNFVLIGAVSGGSNGLRMYGLHKVTAVGASNQITIANRNRNAAMASGAVTGSVRVFKSVLAFAAGISLTLDNSRLGRVENLIIDAEASSTSPSVIAKNSASLDMSGRVGINGNGGAWGLLCDSGSTVNLTDGALCGASYGVYSNMGGYAMAHRAIVTGVVNDGIRISRQSGLTATDCVSTGNGSGIYAEHGSTAAIGSSYVASDNVGTQISPTFNSVGNNNAYIGPG